MKRSKRTDGAFWELGARHTRVPRRYPASMPFELHASRSPKAKALIKAGYLPVLQTSDGMYFDVPPGSGFSTVDAPLVTSRSPEVYTAVREKVQKLNRRRRNARAVTSILFSGALLAFALAFIDGFINTEPECTDGYRCPPPSWEFLHTMMVATLVCAALGLVALRIEARQSRRAIALMEEVNRSFEYEDHIPGNASRQQWISELLRNTDP